MNRKFFVFTEDTFLYKLYINMGGGSSPRHKTLWWVIYVGFKHTKKKFTFSISFFFNTLIVFKEINLFEKHRHVFGWPKKNFCFFTRRRKKKFWRHQQGGGRGKKNMYFFFSFFPWQNKWSVWLLNHLFFYTHTHTHTHGRHMTPTRQ